MQPRLPRMDAAIEVRVVAGARGIHDVLVPGHHVLDVARQGPAGAEQIDLEHQRVDAVVEVEQILERRVRHDAAIPEMVGPDLHHRQGGRQGAARHHVLGLYSVLLVVEVDEVAVEHVDRPHRQARLLLVDQREIDQLQQGLAQGRVVVVAGCRFRARKTEPRARISRREEAGLTVEDGHPGTDGIARLAEDVAIGRVVPDLPLGDALPERPQPLQPQGRRIAGDDGAVDGADRYARYPVRFESGFLKRLVDTRLIGAQRTAALQDERDPIATLGPRNATNCLSLVSIYRLVHRGSPKFRGTMADGA